MGIGSKQENAAIDWFTSIPNLLNGIYCKAWELRKESPLFYVEGGVDAQVPKGVVVMRRRHWELAGDPWGVATFLNSPHFDNNEMFAVVATACHPGAENWPMLTPCFNFPLPLDEMDAWVERQLELNPELAGVVEVLETIRVIRDARPRPRKQKPNEPCACGSGKKFKKCCHK